MARKFHASSQARNATKFIVGMQLQLAFCRFDATAGTRVDDMLREMLANIECNLRRCVAIVCVSGAEVMFVRAIGQTTLHGIALLARVNARGETQVGRFKTAISRNIMQSNVAQTHRRWASGERLPPRDAATPAILRLPRAAGETP